MSIAQARKGALPFGKCFWRYWVPPQALLLIVLTVAKKHYTENFSYELVLGCGSLHNFDIDRCTQEQRDRIELIREHHDMEGNILFVSIITIFLFGLIHQAFFNRGIINSLRQSQDSKLFAMSVSSHRTNLAISIGAMVISFCYYCYVIFGAVEIRF